MQRSDRAATIFAGHNRGCAISHLVPATIFLAVYGDVSRRRNIGNGDAYSLFRERSQAMGWLDTHGIVVTAAGGEAADGSPGYWALYDAGWEAPGSADLPTPLIGWFQVGVDGDCSRVPIQALVECASSVVDRAVETRVTTVQLLAPMQELARGALDAMKPDLADQVAWFAAREATAEVVVVLTGSVHSQDVLVRFATLPALASETSGGPFALIAAEVSSAENPWVPFDRSLLGGAPTDSVRILGVLNSWSADAIGWLMAKVTTLLSDLGAESPVLITISRSDRPTSSESDATCRRPCPK